MKFKIDENLPIEIAEILSRAGQDALTILDEDMGGKPEPDIASICRKEKRIVVTLDADFANLRAYPTEDYPGIIVFQT